MAKASSIFLDELYPKVEKTFNNKQNVTKFSNMVAQFIDKNSEQLTAIAPLNNVLFFDKDRAPLFSMVGVSVEEIRDMKNRSDDLKKYGVNINNSTAILLTVMLRFFTLKNDSKMINTTMSYMVFSFYFSLFKKYFRFPPNENIMMYTINNLSEKYTIKKEGNLFNALQVTAMGAYDLKVNELKRGTDKDIVDLVIHVKTRLNSFLKNIKNEYEKNRNEKKYLNYEIEDLGDDMTRETDASIYAVTRITDKVTTRLITDGPNSKLVKIAANNNHVSVNELRNYTNNIISKNNMQDIHDIVESIIQLFLIDGQNKIERINSDSFLLQSLEVYKKSRSLDKNVTRIKAILDKWIDLAGVYKKTQRLATLNDFKRALYTFIVISIQYINS